MLFQAQSNLFYNCIHKWLDHFRNNNLLLEALCILNKQI